MAAPLIQDPQAINAYNQQMRSMPWYQEWFKAQGLDPNHVHLSKDQRKQLEQVAMSNGAPQGLFEDMMIDPAGNLNNEHGFASQPTWLKALEIGGAVAGGAIAAPGSVGSLFGAGGGTATGGSAAAAAGAPAALESSILGSSAAAAGNAAAAGTAVGAGTGLGSTLGKFGMQTISDLGRVSGGLENTEQENRIDKGRMTQGYDQLMLNAAANKRTDETDALRKLAQTSYLKSGGSQFKPSPLSLNGQTYQPANLGYGPSPSSDAQRAGASTLESQLLTRLQPGGSYTPTKPDYLNRGKLETVGQVGDIIGGYLGTLGQPSGTPPISGGSNPYGGIINTGKTIWNGLKSIF